MAKKAAKKAAKKKTAGTAAKRAGSKKKAPAKTKAAKSKAAKKLPKSKATKEKTGSAQLQDIIGLRAQHVDFLSYKVDQVRKFYGDILGFTTEQRESSLNYLIVHTTSTSSIGFMPPHPQMTGDQPPPREPTLYFLVEDVDRVFATLIARGVAFMGPPQDMPWGHRVVVTTDPEGRTVMLGSESKKA